MERNLISSRSSAPAIVALRVRKGLIAIGCGLLGMALAPSAGAATPPTINVVTWLAPNAFGSPSFAAAEANAVQAMYNNVTSYGTGGTPSYFQAQSNVTSAANIVTGFNSWLGQTDPGTVFGSAFASELGNRMTFAARVDGQGSQFSISQMSFSGVSTVPALNWSNATGSYNYGAGWQGVLKGNDGILWTADDLFVTSGANTQLVDGLVGRGSGNSFDAYCSPCSLAQQQAALNLAASYPGVNYALTGTYTINGATGSGTFNVTAVPEPETYAMLLSGLGLMGFIARRRKEKDAA